MFVCYNKAHKFADLNSMMDNFILLIYNLMLIKNGGNFRTNDSKVLIVSN